MPLSLSVTTSAFVTVSAIESIKTENNPSVFIVNVKKKLCEYKKKKNLAFLFFRFADIFVNFC